MQCQGGNPKKVSQRLDFHRAGAKNKFVFRKASCAVVAPKNEREKEKGSPPCKDRRKHTNRRPRYDTAEKSTNRQRSKRTKGK